MVFTLCCRKSSVPSTPKIEESDVPATVLYELAKDHEHILSVEEVVEIRFNSTHGRSAVQEVALDRGKPVIPLNNFQVVQFNSTHGHSQHNRSTGRRPVPLKTFASAHGRLQSPPINSSSAVITPRSAASNSIKLQDFSKSRSVGTVETVSSREVAVAV